VKSKNITGRKKESSHQKKKKASLKERDLVEGVVDANKKLQQSLDKTLAVAVQNKELNTAKQLLIAGASPNAENEEGVPLLKVAILQRDVEMLKLLAENGLATSGEVGTAILLAINAGNNEAGRFLCTLLEIRQEQESRKFEEALEKEGEGAQTAPPQQMAATQEPKMPVEPAAKGKGAPVAQAAVIQPQAVAPATAPAQASPQSQVAAGAPGSAKSGAPAKAYREGRRQVEVFLNAVARNDLQFVKKMLEANAEKYVNCYGSDWETPLMVAAFRGDEEMMKLLIAKGADVNAIDYNHRTALMHACSIGAVMQPAYNLRKTVEFLIANGADPKLNAEDEDYTTDGFVRIKQERYTVLMELAGATKALETKFTRKEDAHKEIREVMELLISKGTDVSMRNERGERAEDIARQWGPGEIADFLAEKRKQAEDAKQAQAAEEEKVPESRPVRMLKAVVGAVSAAGKKMKAAGKKVKGAGSATPLQAQLSVSEEALHDAVEAGDLKALRKSLKKGVDPNVLDLKSGMTPLMKAVSAIGIIEPEIIKELMEHGANVNLPGPEGKTALILAVENNTPKEILEILIKWRADLNAMDENRNTAIKIALEGRNMVAFELLRVKGADTSAIDNLVRNLEAANRDLLESAARGDYEGVQIALASDAYIFAVDENGRNALDLAVQAPARKKNKKQDNQELIKFLKSKMKELQRNG